MARLSKPAMSTNTVEFFSNFSFPLLVPNYMVKLPEVSSTAKLVYGVLRRYCEKDGIAKVTTDVLNRDLGCGLDKARGAIVELIDHGSIKRVASDTYSFLIF